MAGAEGQLVTQVDDDAALVDERAQIGHAQDGGARQAAEAGRALAAPAVVIGLAGFAESYAMAQALLAAGLPEITHLKGGIQAWTAAGLPVERTQGAPLDLLRQVQITAGGMVLLTVLLGAWLHPSFLLLAGGVGAGLLGAGLSGNCLLASLLSRLPYNRRFAADQVACAPAGIGGTAGRP